MITEENVIDFIKGAVCLTPVRETTDELSSTDQLNLDGAEFKPGDEPRSFLMETQNGQTFRVQVTEINSRVECVLVSCPNPELCESQCRRAQ